MVLDYALRVKQTEVLIVCDTDMLPHYAQAGDAGADLRSAEAFTLVTGERRLVKTGISIALQDGFVGLVHPRSGLALKHGVTVLNAPGTVDAGYRGEIMVTLINHGAEAFVVSKGDRIAQLVVQEVYRAKFIAVDSLPGSDRGQSGFGSSGVS
jgi:dUTP pyrophosphatase